MDPQHYWVVCIQNPSLGQSWPVLTNGTEIKYNGQLFNPEDYLCPDTTSSPIWTGSGKPIYSTNGKPKALARNSSPKALAPASAAYLAQRLLDLPFPAQRAPNDPTTLDCDPAQPDIFQVNHDHASVIVFSPTWDCDLRAQQPKADPPAIVSLHPDGTTAGKVFNSQVDGASAIAVTCKGAMNTTAIVFAGEKLPMVYGGPTLLTAKVPGRLYSKAGHYDVYLVNHAVKNRTSSSSRFSE